MYVKLHLQYYLIIEIKWLSLIRFYCYHTSQSYPIGTTFCIHTQVHVYRIIDKNTSMNAKNTLLKLMLYLYGMTVLYLHVQTAHLSSSGMQ